MISLEKPNSKYEASFIETLNGFECVEENYIFSKYLQIKNDVTREEFSNFVNELNSNPDEHHFWIVYYGEYIGRMAFYNAKDDGSTRLSYLVSPKMRGKGIASAAISMAKDKAYDLGYKSIVVICDPNNIASKKVVIKNGGETIEKTNDNGIEKVLYRIKL